MLDRLIIRDLVLVERAEIAFGPGLNAVTGETGAGKSLLVQAVSLLLGARADAEVVRQGAAAAVVEGEFRVAGALARRLGERLGEWDLEFDGETVIVRREVGAAGRSKASVNQSPVTQATLRRLGQMLADLHGQHEHQSLLQPEAGRFVLDRLGRLEAERAAFAETLAAWREADSEATRLQGSLATLAERADVLRHAASEIDQAKLRAGEDEELALDAARLAHADRLRELVAAGVERLADGEGAAQGDLAAALHALEQAAALDPSLESHLPALREAGIACSEAGRGLARYLDGLEADPAALEAIEQRRDLIARLARRYRRDVPELIAWRAEIARELEAGEDIEGTLARAAERVAAARERCLEAGRELSRRRTEAAAQWGPRLSRELSPLGFEKARIEFAIEPLAEARPGPGGLDHVELRFAPNPGEPGRPLQRIASGGELSRVMLGLKVALEAQDRVDLLLFDEVDSGIGGTVAQAVGERLKRLSGHHQVICVTHLPLIAALAPHHLRVAKQVTAGRTVARIEALGEDERVAELARMLAGERATDTTRRQARELLATRPARAART